MRIVFASLGFVALMGLSIGADATPAKDALTPLPILRIDEINAGSPPMPTLPAGIDDNRIPEPPLLTFSSDYLNWRMRRVPVTVPLLVERRLGGQFIGPTELNPGRFSGLGIGGQLWLSRDRRFGLEGSGRFFEQRTDFDSLTSEVDGLPQYERPFRSTLSNATILVPVSIPGQLSGRFEIATKSRFASGDGGLVVRLWESPTGTFRLQGSVGYRHQYLRESLDLEQTSLSIATGSVLNLGELGTLGTGAGYRISDQLEVVNRFNGAQLGLRGKCEYHSFTLSMGVKTAFGTNQRTLNASGSTVLLPSQSTSVTEEGTTTTTVLPGGVVSPASSTGLFIGAANRGNTSRSAGSFLAEGTLEAGYQVTDRFQVRIGYSGLYWTGVSRPGQLLDPTIDPRQLPISSRFDPNASGANRPGVQFATSNFYAHGWTLGAEWSY